MLQAVLAVSACCTNPVHTAVTRIDCKQPQLHSEGSRTQYLVIVCMPVRVCRCGQTLPAACTWVLPCCTNPVQHLCMVFRTACRQLQLTNRDAQHASARMHACLRVLTRSDTQAVPAVLAWCTNPVQEATAQQPADSSKQVHLIKEPAQFASRHLCTCCNVFTSDRQRGLYPGCFSMLHKPCACSSTTPANRQLQLSTATHNMLWNIRIPIPVSIRAYI
jgi:hypothetical protein